jgi:hypothetical protein
LQRVDIDALWLWFPLKQHCHAQGIPDAVISPIARNISHCSHHFAKSEDCSIRMLTPKNFETEPILIKNTAGFQTIKTTQQPRQCHHVLPAITTGSKPLVKITFCAADDFGPL